MPSIDEPREVVPFSRDVKKLGGFKDFGLIIEKSDTQPEEPVEVPSDEQEQAEVEEALTPAPKDSSVLESAISSETKSPAAPTSQDSPALPESVVPTVESEDADKANGKDSEPSEAAPQTPSQTTPADESSSQTSSSETSPGSDTPPAPVQPPPVASPPVAPTTPKQ